MEVHCIALDSRAARIPRKRIIILIANKRDGKNEKSISYNIFYMI